MYNDNIINKKYSKIEWQNMLKKLVVAADIVKKIVFFACTICSQLSLINILKFSLKAVPKSMLSGSAI